MDAAADYEKNHRHLSQKLVDYSIEQGSIFSGGVLDADELSLGRGICGKPSGVLELRTS